MFKRIKMNRFISMFLSVAMLLGILTASPIASSAQTTSFVYEGFKVDYNINGGWADNQNIQVTLTNTGTEPIRSWALQYDPNGTINGIWNGEVFADDVIKSVAYNSDISVGGSVSFGYTLMGATGTPDSFALCNYRVEKEDGYTVSLTTAPDWGSGFTGMITITNTTDVPIMAWELGFSANFNIISAGDFTILENSGEYYRITGIHNGNIPANSSVVLTFEAASSPSAAISDFSLSEVIVSDVPIGLNEYDWYEYEPQLPQGLDALLAFGFYDSEEELIILEWTYQDNTGKFKVFDIINGKKLITTVTDKSYLVISIDTEKEEYIFVVEKDISGNGTIVSNEVVMRLNEYGEYEFIFTDSDGDGLPDVYELVLGTDPFNPDTDGDGLPDGYEVFTLGTDPLLYDTSGEGLSDGEYDFDEDGLTNLEEFLLGTDPLNPDTDGDGLSDYDEVNVYGTDPINPDTDGDGLPDARELEYGMNPLNPDTLNDGILDGDRIFEVLLSGELSDNGLVQPHLLIELQGKQIDSLTIEKVKENDLFLNSEIPGYLGNAFDFTVDGEFLEATLTYEFDESFFDDPDFVPAIYYWNEEIQFLEELPDQVIDGNTVSVMLEHFSSYMVIAINEYKEELFRYEILAPSDEKFQNKHIDLAIVIDNSGSMSKDSSPKNDRYGYRHTLAKELIDKLGDNDRVCIVNFGTNAVLQTQFTYNKTTAKIGVDTYTDGGTTALYNAINVANNHFISNARKDAAKIMIVLTDGINNVSGSTLAGVTQAAVQNDIIIYTIGLGTQLDLNALTSLAYTTGGTYFHAENANQLFDVFDMLEYEVDLIKDSDGDGISDYHEKKLIAGELKIGNNSYFPDFDKLKCEGEEGYDSDNDSLSDGEEIEIRSQYVSGREIYYVYMKSNPCAKDTDGDGVLDNEDTAPLIKGIIGENGNVVIGEMTIISHNPSGINPGHAFLIYQSYVIDELDFTGLTAGYTFGTTTLVKPSMYSIEPSNYVAIGNAGNGIDDNPIGDGSSSGGSSSGGSSSGGSSSGGSSNGGSSSGGSSQVSESGSSGIDGDAGGVYFNREFANEVKSYNEGKGGVYTQNKAYTKQITEAQLNVIIAYSAEYNYYNLFTNNCALVAAGSWNRAFSDDTFNEKMLPSSLKKQIGNRDGSYAMCIVRDVLKKPTCSSGC